MMQDFFKINIGQVFTVLVILFGAIGVWFKTKFKLDAVSEKLNEQDKVIREFEAKGVVLVLGQHEARLMKLEALQLDIGLMRTDIALIRQSLENEKQNKRLND